MIIVTERILDEMVMLLPAGMGFSSAGLRLVNFAAFLAFSPGRLTDDHHGANTLLTRRNRHSGSGLVAGGSFPAAGVEAGEGQENISWPSAGWLPMPDRRLGLAGLAAGMR